MSKATDAMYDEIISALDAAEDKCIEKGVLVDDWIDLMERVVAEIEERVDAASWDEEAGGGVEDDSEDKKAS